MRHELTNWQPRELVLQALQQPLDLFAAGCGSTHLLVVVLDVAHAELASGLSSSLEASNNLDGDRRGARSDLLNQEITFIEPADRMGSKSSPSRGWDAAGQRVGLNVEQIAPELRRVPCYVVPLRKRADGSFLQHISVGRARNHDIVLRHPSVSKFHAWFEMHEAPQLFVKDVGSQNHTFVNGQETAGRVAVAPGQTVRFGSVECTLCTPQGLWSIMHP
ncbi:MAG: hypothetical protein JWN04_1060 [Myxococcaceae bacterium]|nr:hypothetical protein [Myxococcaceae bacterium]